MASRRRRAWYPRHVATHATPLPPSLRAALDEVFATLPERAARAGAGRGGVPRDRRRLRPRARASGSRPRRDGAPLALVATGGWARRELAPYSDIDFIVLHDRDEAAAKRVSRSAAVSAVGREARDRPLGARGRARRPGSRRTTSRPRPRCSTRATSPAIGALTTELVARHARRARARRQPQRADRRARRREEGAPRSVRRVALPARAQPQAGHRRAARSRDRAVVRGGSAGTRRARASDPEDAEQLIATLVDDGPPQPPPGAGARSARATSCCASARSCSSPRKRRFDQLTFEIQEAIAPALYPDARPHEGDVRSAVAPAVEALMRDYYLHARGVVQVADRLLESARVPARATAADRAGRRRVHHVQRRARDQGSAAVRRAAERDGAAVPRRGRRAAAGLRPHPRARRRDDRARSGAARARSAAPRGCCSTRSSMSATPRSRRRSR